MLATWQGYLSVHLNEGYYQLAAKRHPEVPPLTDLQKEALQVRGALGLWWALTPLYLLSKHEHEPIWGH